MSELLDTREVAAYLRLKERRIYELVRRHAIPHVRATGKLLFPRNEIDAWLASKTHDIASPASAAETPTGKAEDRVRPPIIAGSHDPLLEWAARESRCALAILACGSRDGVQRLAHGTATAAAAHWRDEATGEFNLGLVQELLADAPVVALEWAQRTQGLLLAPGNPRRVRTLRDLARHRLRLARRQPGAGSHRLFGQLLARAGVAEAGLHWIDGELHAESEVAQAVREGRADAGFGIEAAAHASGLAFIPLAVERLDLVCHRRDAFEPPLQALLSFTRTPGFAARAQALHGYDVSQVGRVVFNA